MPMDSSFFDQVCKASTTDPLVLDIKHLTSNIFEEFFKFKIQDNLFFGEHLFILEGPIHLCVLQTCHDFPTLEFLSSDFWWPKMWKDVKEFVLLCDICSKSKNT